MTTIKLPNDTNITLGEYDLMYLDELSEPARKAGVKEKVNPKCNCKVFEAYLKPEIRITHKIGFVTQEEIEKNRHNIKVFLNTHRVV